MIKTTTIRIQELYNNTIENNKPKNVEIVNITINETNNKYYPIGITYFYKENKDSKKQMKSKTRKTEPSLDDILEDFGKEELEDFEKEVKNIVRNRQKGILIE